MKAICGWEGLCLATIWNQKKAVCVSFCQIRGLKAGSLAKAMAVRTAAESLATWLKAVKATAENLKKALPGSWKLIPACADLNGGWKRIWRNLAKRLQPSSSGQLNPVRRGRLFLSEMEGLLYYYSAFIQCEMWHLIHSISSQYIRSWEETLFWSWLYPVRGNCEGLSISDSEMKWRVQ